jgi:hypothetical protein
VTFIEESPQDTSLVDMDLELNINFLEAWAFDLQCTTFKGAWLKLIARSLGGNESLHKFL